jgi:hypothetical protein
MQTDGWITVGKMERVEERSAALPTAGLIERSMVATVERSPLLEDPFDHVYMEDIFSPEVYAALVGMLPERRFYHQLMHRDAIRSDGSSTRLRMYLYPELLRRLPSGQREAWMAVGKALCSKELQTAFKRKFRGALEQRFRKPVETLGLYPVPILLRDLPGYRIGIHSDVGSKAITVQFYLPRDDSQRHMGTIFHEGSSGELAEKMTKMVFKPASGYAFPVALTKSWHSAPTVMEADGERISMMVTYYVADEIPSRIFRRLRRAALFFGIHPKG